MIVVTAHAAQRYVERIAPALSLEETRAAIAASARAIEVAADFGCTRVRQANGAVLRLQGATVATVVRSHRRIAR